MTTNRLAAPLRPLLARSRTISGSAGFNLFLQTPASSHPLGHVLSDPSLAYRQAGVVLGTNARTRSSARFSGHLPARAAQLPKKVICLQGLGSWSTFEYDSLSLQAILSPVREIPTRAAHEAESGHGVSPKAKRAKAECAAMIFRACLPVGMAGENRAVLGGYSRAKGEMGVNPALPEMVRLC